MQKTNKQNHQIHTHTKLHNCAYTTQNTHTQTRSYKTQTLEKTNKHGDYFITVAAEDTNAMPDEELGVQFGFQHRHIGHLDSLGKP